MARVQQRNVISGWVSYLDVFLVEYCDEVSDEAVVREEPLVLAVDVHLEVFLRLVNERPHQL